MRLDHIAYRVKDRHKAVRLFEKVFGYKVQTEFEIEFEDKSKAKCFALEPPEKIEGLPFICHELGNSLFPDAEYHLAPEIFVSDGSSDSIVGKWVEARNGIGGLHHMAYQVDSVEKIMEKLKAEGYFEFTTEQPLTCPGLTQCFTKPSEITGVIYEFIEREGQGFCKENVKDLMLSTDNL